MLLAITTLNTCMGSKQTEVLSSIKSARGLQSHQVVQIHRSELPDAAVGPTGFYRTLSPRKLQKSEFLNVKPGGRYSNHWVLKGYEQGYYKSKVTSTQNYEWTLNDKNSTRIM
jgi:hypothetical protein